MRRCRILAGAAAVLLWALFSLTAGIRIVAGDGQLIAREMLRAAPAGTTGLPESEYAGVGEMIAGYLTGRQAEFQYEYVSREGTPVRCFGEREQRHMEDVRGLIRLDEAVMGLSLAAAVALAAAGTRDRGTVFFVPPAWDKKDRPPVPLRGLRIGAWTLAALASGLILWAAADFDGFFLTFHRLAFTNDLWLLDPRRELLIRLMPTSFFVRLAGIAGAWALGIGLVGIAVCRLARGGTGGRSFLSHLRGTKKTVPAVPLSHRPPSPPAKERRRESP